MKCPICTTVDLKLADRQGVEIDYCPECRGIWLDRGELDKLIERSYAPAAMQNAPAEPFRPQGHHEAGPFGKQHHDKHGSHHNQPHGRKSWLAELFD